MRRFPTCRKGSSCSTATAVSSSAIRATPRCIAFARTTSAPALTLRAAARTTRRCRKLFGRRRPISRRPLRGRQSRHDDQPVRRARRRPHHRRGERADGRRRLGGHPRGHHRTAPVGNADRAHGAARCADRSAQPRAAAGTSRRCAHPRGTRATARRPVPRPRPLQERQRFARAPHRRRALARSGRPAARLRARNRHHLARRRRRIRDHPDRHHRRHRCGAIGAPPRRGDRRALRPSGAHGRDRDQHRHRGGARRRDRSQRASQERRHGALRREGGRPRRLSLLRAEHGCAHESAPRARARSSARRWRTTNSNCITSRR